MSYTITPLDEATATPLNEKGEPYLHVLVRADDAVYGDTATDLCEAIIPDYDTLDHDPDGDREALIKRYEASVVIADDLQQMLHASASEEVRASLTEEETAVVTTSRADSVVSLDQPWEHEIPLLLIATDYAPYTDTPAPVGEVAFINPHTEASFLISTSQLDIWDYADLREELPSEQEVID